MVIAGMKKIKMTGMIPNTLLRDEKLAKNTWLVKNHPVSKRNTDMTIYATGE